MNQQQHCVVAWVAASIIGTQAYYFGEQTETIHERNWNSPGFERFARLFTGRETDYSIAFLATVVMPTPVRLLAIDKSRH